MHQEDQIRPLSFSSMKEPVILWGVLAVTLFTLAVTITTAASTTTNIYTTTSDTEETSPGETTTSEVDKTTSRAETTTSGRDTTLDTDETTPDNTTPEQDTTASGSDQTTLGNDTISSTRSDGNLYLENGSSKKPVPVLVYVTTLLLAVTNLPGRLIGPAIVVMDGMFTEGLA